MVRGFRVDSMRLSADEVADSILEQSLQRYHMMTADCVPGTNNTDQTYTSQTNSGQTEGDA